MYEISTLIIGATVYGIGAAINKPDGSLIVEKSMLIGSEFIDSMNIKRCSLKCEEKYAQKFKDDLTKRNLLNENGEMHIFPVANQLAEYIKNCKVSIYFMTDIVNIEGCDGGFLVTIFNADGFSEIYTKKIIDTTTESILSSKKLTVPYQKYLCAMLLSNGGNKIDNYMDEKAMILKGKFMNEYVLKIKLDNGDEWQRAREVLHSYWQTHINSVFKNWKIASVASAFAYDFEDEVGTEVQEGWILKPSASYPDLLSAFQEGIKCAALL